MAYKIKKQKANGERRTWYFYVDEKRVIKVPNTTMSEGDDIAKYYAKKKLHTGTAGGMTYVNPVNKDIEGSEKIKIFEVTAKDKKEGKSYIEPRTLVDDIIAYEEGTLSEKDTLRLFQKLEDSGQAYSLQGSYGRTATALIGAGLIKPNMKYHTKEQVEQ